MKNNGKPDIITIAKTFESVNAARLYEHTELTRLNAVDSDNFLNKSAGLGIPPMPGNKNPFYGKKHSEETRKK